MTKPVPPAPADPILHRLDVLARASPDLKPIAVLYAAILPLLRDAELRVEPVGLLPEQARAKLQAGVPLLCGEALAFDETAARDLMIAMAYAMEELRVDALTPKRHASFFHRSQSDATALADRVCVDTAERAAAARAIRLALEQNIFEIDALLSQVASGNSEFVTACAQNFRLDPGLLWTLAQNSVRPALRAWAKQLAPLRRGSAWDRGYCFICGASATLGELQDNGQVKHLRCGQCGADWQTPRLACAFCGNDDPHTLTFLFAPKQREHQQIEACDRCRGYLKLIAAFSPTPAEMLAVEDLATLHLDYIAQARGYTCVAIR